LEGSSPLIVNNSVCHNNADMSGGGAFLYAVMATALLSQNDIQYNTSVSSGGGIYIRDCGPRVVGNNVSNNTSKSGGGLFVAINHTGIEPPDVSFDILSMNSADFGAAICVINSAIVEVIKPCIFVTGCEVVDNICGSPTYDAAAIYVTYPYSFMKTSQSIILDRCTIANNSGTGVYTVSASLICNSILWGNKVDYSNSILTNCCFKGAIEGTSSGNMSSFPYLKTDGSYGLESYSPCIDAGNPFTVIEPDEQDIYGNSRLVGTAIDMGAVEAVTKSNIQPGGLPDEWLSLYSLTGEDALPDADPDSDGLANLEEYQEGSDPTVGNPVVNVYVDINSTVTPQTGMIDAPFTSLQQAVTVARGGATIRVAQGTYSETVAAAGKSVYILGGYQGWDDGTSTEIFNDEDRSYSTIVDATGSTGSPVFSFVQCFDASLDGFTIQNGSGDKGGGVCSIDSYVSISSNVVLSNSATLGGGIYCEGMGINYPYIRGNIIHDNEATSGGGIYAAGTSPRIHNNTIYSNTADATGGGISCSGSTPSIYNNLIGKSSLMTDTSNHPNQAQLGGGIYLFMCSGGTDGKYLGTNAVDAGSAWGGNVITGNTANAGGGICLHCCTGIQIRSNVVAENEAPEGGGILILSSQGTDILNTTVANNVSQ